MFFLFNCKGFDQPYRHIGTLVPKGVVTMQGSLRKVLKTDETSKHAGLLEGTTWESTNVYLLTKVSHFMDRVFARVCRMLNDKDQDLCDATL